MARTDLRRGFFQCLEIAFVSFGLMTFSSCSNYHFEEALRADGKYDIDKMIRDSQQRTKSGAGGVFSGALYSGLWIPLAFDREVFFSETPDTSASPGFLPDLVPIIPWESYPAGYRLAQSQGYGPLRFYSSSRVSHYTPAGEGYEILEQKEIFLRLWRQTRSWVKTPQGTREENRHEILLGIFPVYHGIRYLPGEGAHRELTP